MNPELKTRLKSFAWRTAWLIAVGLVAFAVDPATMEWLAKAAPKWAWALPVYANVGGELSKWIKNKLEDKQYDRQLLGK